jgi:hypothetical protein
MRISIMKSLYIHFLMPLNEHDLTLVMVAWGRQQEREEILIWRSRLPALHNWHQVDLIQADERTELDAGLGGIAFIYTHSSVASSG